MKVEVEDIKAYLSSIEEYIFDEKRIITSTWLAITLGIHVDLAKHLLQTFYETNTKKEELSATYLLIGKSNNSKDVHITVVQEKHLKEAENKFNSITSKHVYSVQKSSDISDLNMLYLAGKTNVVEVISKGISAIEFNCKERDSDLMEKLRLNALPAKESKTSVFAKKTLNSNQENKNMISSTEPKVQQPVKQNAAFEETKKSEVKPDDKKIPAMFSKTTSANSKKTEPNKANAAKKSQGIGAFFSKAPQKKNYEIKKSAPDNDLKEVDTKETSPLKENKPSLNNKNEEEKSSRPDECNSQASTKTAMAQEPKPKQKQKQKKVESKRAKSKKVDAKKKQNEGKQRKRLMVISDSDSEQTSDEEAKEEELRREPSPEPMPVAVVLDDDDDIISATPEPATRKRKKKLVSRTFTGADGYMVTQKELVDVSCSEDESEDVNPQKKLKSDMEDKGKKIEEPSSKNEDINSKKTSKETMNNHSKPKGKKEQAKSNTQSPQKTKQASLMSFFKKK